MRVSVKGTQLQSSPFWLKVLDCTTQPSPIHPPCPYAGPMVMPLLHIMLLGMMQVVCDLQAGPELWQARLLWACESRHHPEHGGDACRAAQPPGRRLAIHLGELCTSTQHAACLLHTSPMIDRQHQQTSSWSQQGCRNAWPSCICWEVAVLLILLTSVLLLCRASACPSGHPRHRGPGADSA